MKIIISRRELSDALKNLLKAVAVKSETPILSGIYFKAENSNLEMQATDYTLGIITKISANVEDGGETVLLGKKLFEIVQKLTGDVVTITYTQGENVAEIKSAGTKYNLFAMAAEDFPKIRQKDDFQSFRLRQSELKKLIDKSAFSAAEEKLSSRQVFTGVLFKIENEKLTLAATNTHRLSVISTTLDENFEGEEKFIISAKILQEISAMLVEGEVEVNFNDKQANFIFDNYFIQTRLISDDFPPFDRLLNEERTIFVEVDAAEFLQAIERVAVIAKETNYQTVKLNIGENEIEISASTPEVGKAEEVVSAEVKGGDLEIYFNYKYLADVLKVSEGKIKIGMSEKLKPADFRLSDFQYIVTPVRSSD